MHSYQKTQEQIENLKQGNKKAAQEFYEEFRIDRGMEPEKQEDFYVDLSQLQDEELMGLHQKTTWLAPSYFLRRRYYHLLPRASDEVLLVLTQIGSHLAKEILLSRYRHHMDQASDEVLVLLAQEENEIALDYLVKRFIPIIQKLLHKLTKEGYYFKGMEEADLIQEGVLGLFKSTNDYKVERKTKFVNFARQVIKRHMGTLIIRSVNNKNLTLNDSYSYHTPIGNDSDITFEQMLKSDLHKPENSFITMESLKDIWKLLTHRERKVILLFDEGYSYQEIAEIMGTNIKAVDNTIQRVRNKGKRYRDKYI